MVSTVVYGIASLGSLLGLVAVIRL
jgi:hypothetical protein